MICQRLCPIRVTNPADPPPGGGSIASVNLGNTCRAVPVPGSAGGRSIWLAGLAGVIAAGLAALPVRAAAEPSPAPGPVLTIDGLPGRRLAIDTPRDRSATANAQVSPTLYLNRCTGNCVVTRGSNDARNHTSSIPGTTDTPVGTMFTITEYQNAAKP